MKTLIENMGILIDSVGQKILNANEFEEYKNKLVKQEIYTFCDYLVEEIELDKDGWRGQKSERITYIQQLLDVLYESIDTDIWDSFRQDEEDEYMKFYDYFGERGIDLANCLDDLDETLIENRRFYDNTVFREMLINQLVENENYNTLFEEIS